jgi:hypothetical protein
LREGDRAREADRAREPELVLGTDLAALATLSSAQLHRRWAEVTGKVLPKVSPSMLRRGGADRGGGA